MSTGMIRVKRNNSWSGKFRAFRIFIDDVDHGKIRSNQIKEFLVENGAHTVYVKLDFHKSQKLYVHVDNSAVTIEAVLPLAMHSNNPRLKCVSEEPLSVEAEKEAEAE